MRMRQNSLPRSVQNNARVVWACACVSISFLFQKAANLMKSSFIQFRYTGSHCFVQEVTVHRHISWWHVGCRASPFLRTASSLSSPSPALEPRPCRQPGWCGPQSTDNCMAAATRGTVASWGVHRLRDPLEQDPLQICTWRKQLALVVLEMTFCEVPGASQLSVETLSQKQILIWENFSIFQCLTRPHVKKFWHMLVLLFGMNNSKTFPLVF